MNWLPIIGLGTAVAAFGLGLYYDDPPNGLVWSGIAGLLWLTHIIRDATP